MVTPGSDVPSATPEVQGLHPRRLSGRHAEIPQQLRDYAREKGIDEEQAVAAPRLEKSGEFKEAGGEIYS
jgi:hypothetical protein